MAGDRRSTHGFRERVARLALVAIPLAAVLAVTLTVAPGVFGRGAVTASDSAIIPAGERSWIVDSAPEPQQEALADLSVSRAEYVAAVGKVRACMADAGVETTEPIWQGNQLSFEFGGTADRAGLAPMKAVYKDCNDRYLLGIATGWAIGSSPPR